MSGMAGARPFVAQLELRRQVVADILLSLLNDPVTTHHQSPRHIPRRLLASAPTDIALWWDAPNISFDNATDLIFTVRLAGGVRQPETGRILTVSGPARARLRMEVMSDTWRTPYLGLSFVALDLSGLAVTYAGAAVVASADEPTTPDIRRSGSPLWRLVNEALSTPLTRLPLSFVWSALTDWQGRELRLGAATVSALDAETVALTFASTHTPTDEAGSARAGGAYLDPTGDFALTLSADGMTQLAAHLLTTGALPKHLRDETDPQSDRQDGGWTTVESLAVTLRAGVASLVAHMRHDDGNDPQDANVIIDLSFEIDNRGSLLVTPVGLRVSFRTVVNDQRQDARYAAAEAALSAAGRTLASAFDHALPNVFGQRSPTGPADRPRLPRQATIPSTPLTRVVTPTRVVVSEGALTFVCALPASDAQFVAQPPDLAPGVAIGAAQRPTTRPLGGVTLEATIVTPSFPPYDYRWATDTRPPDELPQHTPTITIFRSAPASGPLMTQGDVAAIPTRAEVTLIDAFGQVTRDSIRLPVLSPSEPPLLSPDLLAPAELAPAILPSNLFDQPDLAPGQADDAGGFDVVEATTDIVPAIPPGAAQVWSANAGSVARVSSPSWRAQRSRRRPLLLVALIALALGVAALSGYLALNHPSSGSLGAAGLGHGAAYNGTTGAATHAAGGGSPTSVGQGAPGATTTPAPGATTTPAPGATPTATVPSASTPTPTLAPGETPTPPGADPSLSVNNTSNSQGCIYALSPPAAFTLTLLNNGAADVNWQIAITQTDSTGKNPWASASESTGSLTPGASTTVVITPTAASCPGALASATYFLTVTANNVDGSGVTETIQVNDVISDL